MVSERKHLIQILHSLSDLSSKCDEKGKKNISKKIDNIIGVIIKILNYLNPDVSRPPTRRSVPISTLLLPRSNKIGPPRKISESAQKIIDSSNLFLETEFDPHEKYNMKSVKKSRKLSVYNKFVQKHMKDKDLQNYHVTDRMKKIAKMWKKTQ